MSIKKYQKMASKFAAESKFNLDPCIRMVAASEELGELAKEVLVATDYGTKSLETNDKLLEEVGDVLFELLLIADLTGVSATEAFFFAMGKMSGRVKEKGHAGSRN